MAPDLDALERRRTELRERYLRPTPERPQSSARGVHHVAVLCTDVEQTIRFYQDLLEFPLTDLFENRDYRGSTHFFSTSATATRWRSSTSRASLICSGATT